MITVTLKENTFLAKIAAKNLGHSSAAIVFGRTIYLYNVDRTNFIKNQSWLKHEIAHVKQYEKLGLIKFILLYLIELMIKGYANNRFEVEARQKESDDQILSNVVFV